MKMLVIGATGRIGSVLLDRARARGYEAEGTTRRAERGSLYFLDLLRPADCELPYCNTAFLLAGYAGFRQCEANAEAWRVNVDGLIAVAKALIRRKTFIVFPSSVALEWAGNSQYGRAKAAVESFLHASCDPAIIRFDLLTSETLPPLVERLIDIGAGQRPGMFYL